MYYLKVIVRIKPRKRDRRVGGHFLCSLTTTKCKMPKTKTKAKAKDDDEDDNDDPWMHGDLCEQFDKGYTE